MVVLTRGKRLPMKYNEVTRLKKKLKPFLLPIRSYFSHFNIFILAVGRPTYHSKYWNLKSKIIRVLRGCVFFGCLGGLVPVSTSAETRIVSTSPQITEIFFQLGKGRDIVATSDFSIYPEEARKIPTLGPVFMPNIERVLLQSIDWIVTDRSAPDSFVRTVRRMGFHHVALDVESVEDLVARSERLFQVIYGSSNVPRISVYRKCLESLRRTSPPSFSFLAFVWLNPPILFGVTTFLSDLIHLVGGQNSFPPKLAVSYPKVSDEWLMSRGVDTVFYLVESPDVHHSMKAMAKKWWPIRQPKLVPLPAENFGRASFTPLHHLKTLNEDLSLPFHCERL